MPGWSKWRPGGPQVFRHPRSERQAVDFYEFAEVLTKRAAVSWFDMSGGWFSHPRLLADLGRACRILKESLPRRKPLLPR